MKVLVALTLSLFSTVALAQDGPMPADRLTPAMLAEIEHEYPQGAVDCLKDSLKKVAASGRNYLFTSDYQLGQLWLISLESLSDDSVRPYICTPKGLADTPEAAAAAMFGGGMAFPQ